MKQPDYIPPRTERIELPLSGVLCDSNDGLQGFSEDNRLRDDSNNWGLL